MLKYAVGILIIGILVFALLFFRKKGGGKQDNSQLRVFQDGTPKLCNGDEYSTVKRSLSESRFLKDPEHVPYRSEIHLSTGAEVEESAKKTIDKLPKATDQSPYSQTGVLISEVMQILDQQQLFQKGIHGEEAAMHLMEKKPSLMFLWYHERLVANRYCIDVQQSFQGYSTFEFAARAIDSYGICPEFVYHSPNTNDEEEFNCKLTQTPPNWTYQHTDIHPNLQYNCIYRGEGKNIEDARIDCKYLLNKNIPVLCIVRCPDAASLIDRRKLDVPLHSIDDEEADCIAVYLYGYDEHQKVFHARSPWGSEMLNHGSFSISFGCWSQKTPMIREAGYLSCSSWTVTQDIKHTKPKDIKDASFTFY